MDNELDLIKLNQYYSSIGTFVNKHSELSFARFERLSVLETNLFSSIDNIDFANLNDKLSIIIKTIPAIKRIFARPYIHLIDNDELVPLEAVKVVNNDTLTYAAIHTELWDDVTPNGIKPIKVLTRKNLDNYSIYENIVFAKAIDLILNFTKKYNDLLRDLFFVEGNLEINLLERANHLSYYIALGKLHTGYIRSFELYKDDALKCINKLQFIRSTIIPRLSKPVYKKNKNKHRGISLQKTNIFAMHKDYNKIYLLIKQFMRTTENIDNIAEVKQLVRHNYLRYLEMLTLFSLSHFNFTANEQSKINFNNLDVMMRFRTYEINVKEKNGAVLLTFKKENEYRILFVPKVDSEPELNQTSAEEKIYVSPVRDGNLFISINNIESFRRLQQIILRGMIYSDKKRDFCPFCGSYLTQVDGKYVCNKCNMRITELTCPETDKKYYGTDINNFVFHDDDAESLSEWAKNKKEENKYHFRNITGIVGGKFVCPHCGKVH